MICPNCYDDTRTLRTVIRRGKIVSGCNKCVAELTSGGQNDISKYNRDRQREDYRQDVVQPFEGKNYIRARGIDKAREMGYSDEDIRQLY